MAPRRRQGKSKSGSRPGPFRRVEIPGRDRRSRTPRNPHQEDQHGETEQAKARKKPDHLHGAGKSEADAHRQRMAISATRRRSFIDKREENELQYSECHQKTSNMAIRACTNTTESTSVTAARPRGLGAVCRAARRPIATRRAGRARRTRAHSPPTQRIVAKEIMESDISNLPSGGCSWCIIRRSSDTSARSARTTSHRNKFWPAGLDAGQGRRRAKPRRPARPKARIPPEPKSGKPSRASPRPRPRLPHAAARRSRACPPDRPLENTPLGFLVPHFACCIISMA